MHNGFYISNSYCRKSSFLGEDLGEEFSKTTDHARSGKYHF